MSRYETALQNYTQVSVFEVYLDDEPLGEKLPFAQSIRSAHILVGIAKKERVHTTIQIRRDDGVVVQTYQT